MIRYLQDIFFLAKFTFLQRIAHVKLLAAKF